MKAIHIHSLGDPEILRYEDVPDPQAGVGEVLIKVAADVVPSALAGKFMNLPLRKGWQVGRILV